MPTNSTKYAVDVLLNPEDFPTEDKSVIWDTSSGSFALGDAPGNSDASLPQFVYQPFDGVEVLKTFEVGSVLSTPNTGKFRMQPDGQTDSNLNANSFGGGSSDRIQPQVTYLSEEYNYLSRAGDDEQTAGFMFSTEEPRSFFAFVADVEKTLFGGTKVGFDFIKQADYQYAPYQQNFWFDDNTALAGDRWAQNNKEYAFIIMTPSQDGNQGLVYRAGGAQRFFTQEPDRWLILTSKPSGSSQNITEYLKSYSGGTLTFTKLDDPKNYIIYKFDESFEIVTLMTDPNPDEHHSYVCFAGLKTLINTTDEGGAVTASDKFVVTVNPTKPRHYEGFHAENTTELHESEMVTRRVFVENKGNTVYAGRKYEWGNQHTGSYGTLNISNMVGGDVLIRGYGYNTGDEEYNFSSQGVWAVDDDNGLYSSTSYSPGYGNFMALVDTDQNIATGHDFVGPWGPQIPFLRNVNSSANNLPNTPIVLIVSWNFTKKTPYAAP